MEYQNILNNKREKLENQSFEIGINLIRIFIYFYSCKYYLVILMFSINIYITFNIINSIKNNNQTIYNYNAHINQLIKSINEYIIFCRLGKSNKNIFHFSLYPKITAIIILYNSQKTIKRAIRSIQNQNISDIEILLIDDYSTDNSITIIEEIAKNDLRIKLLKNNQNRGALYSRSIGALNARGNYIMALDSDDLFINTNLFNICYEEMTKYNLDIIEFAGFHIKRPILKRNNKLPKKAYYLRFKPYDKIIKQPKLFNSLYQKNKTHIIRLIDGYIWGKCIRKNIYVKALDELGENIYTQNLNFGEDRIINFIFFRVAQSFKYINLYGIIYYYNSLSIYNSYKKELIVKDELINLMSIYNYTKNSSLISILIYEINFRWETIIKPGLNLDNKKKINYLIHLLLNNKYVKEIEKQKLITYRNEIK